MFKKTFRVLSFVVALHSTSAAAYNAKGSPSSMQPGYNNGFVTSVSKPAYKTTTVTTRKSSYSTPPSAANPAANYGNSGAITKPVSMTKSEQKKMEAFPAEENPYEGVIVGGRLTTLGYGAEIGTMVSENIGVRGNLQHISGGASHTEGSIKYDNKIDWTTGGALVDFYPSDSSGFRLTGGGYLGGNDMDFHATPSASTVIGNNTYTTGQIGTVTGKAKTNYFAPYAGIGYNSFHNDFGNWNVGIDVGVKFNGDPEVALSSSGGGVSAADLAVESGKIEDDMDLTKFYPVAGLTIGYKF